MNNFEFIAFCKADIESLTSKREGEIKLGETFDFKINEDTEFVILGVCEDIGPQSNLGNPGSQNSFLPAIRKLLNMQSNRQCHGRNTSVIGYIKQNCLFTSVNEGRKLVEELDDLVANLLLPYFEKGIIPIIIGGGHNNAYPIIRAYSECNNAALEVVNLDPHADCRAIEGRHSGNPFSYAKKDGYLSQYTVLGLHAAYNSESMLSYMNEQQFYYSYFEEYMIRPEKLNSDLQTIIIRSDHDLGIELDLDSIKGMPSSAFTPSGFELEDVRKYIMKLASSKRRSAYLHLPEGAPVNENEEKIVAKSIAYLIHDFIATSRQKN